MTAFHHAKTQARTLAAAESISYTAALRRLRDTAPTAPLGPLGPPGTPGAAASAGGDTGEATGRLAMGVRGHHDILTAFADGPGVPDLLGPEDLVGIDVDFAGRLDVTNSVLVCATPGRGSQAVLRSLQWSFADLERPGGEESRTSQRELLCVTDLGDLGAHEDLGAQLRLSRSTNTTVVVVTHSAASALAYLPESSWSVRVVLGQVNDADAEAASQVLLGGQVSVEEVRTAPTARGWILGPGGDTGTVVQPFTALPRSRAEGLWVRPRSQDRAETGLEGGTDR